MDLEQWDPIQGPAFERSEADEPEPAEIVIGLRHMLTVMALFAAAAFVAGFGWWTLSTSMGLPEIIDSLVAESAETNLTTGQAPAPVSVPTAPQPQPAARRMALPPVRKGFKPKPEATGVKGDPNAPVTIVEYSDYQ